MKKTFYCYHAYYEIHIACHEVVGTFFNKSSDLKELLKEVYNSFSHCCHIIVFDDALDNYCELTNRDVIFTRELFDYDYANSVADGIITEESDDGRNHEWYEMGDIENELDSIFNIND